MGSFPKIKKIEIYLLILPCLLPPEYQWKNLCFHSALALALQNLRQIIQKFLCSLFISFCQCKSIFSLLHLWEMPHPSVCNKGWHESLLEFTEKIWKMLTKCHCISSIYALDTVTFILLNIIIPRNYARIFFFFILYFQNIVQCRTVYTSFNGLV